MENVTLAAPPVKGLESPVETGPLPSAAAIGRAVAGFALLGLCAALGTGEIEGAARVFPEAPVTALGALVLTAPALLVGHQYLGLKAPVAELGGALGHAFCRAGGIALGLCPALLFFAATSGLATRLLALFLLGIASIGLADAYTGLRGAERAAGADVLADLKMQGLVTGWMALTTLVGLRLGAHLAGF